MSDTNWIVSRGTEKYPVADIAMLQEWVANGSISPYDQIWSPAKGEWYSARDLPEIALAFHRPESLVSGKPLTSGSPLVLSPSVAAAGIRVAAYLIDLLPALVTGLIAMIPIIGQFIGGVLLGCYWLLRDVTGASIGKLALGLRVVDGNRLPAPISSRIIRNIPLCLGPFLLAIPFIGYILGPSVAVITLLVEAVMLITQGNRLGDRLAGTTVVKTQEGRS